jgi:PEP-CTERM motif
MRKLRSTVSRLGPRGGSLQLGLLIGMTLSAVATGAQAATIFSTGFEPPDFTTGPLAGQQGWTGVGGTVETGTVFAGVQAVGFDTTGLSTQQLNGLGVPTAGQGSLVQVSDEFFVSAVNGSADWDVLSASGNAGFIGQLEVTNGIASLGLTDSSVGAVPVSIGAWNNYTMDFNFATGIQSAFVDGALIGTGPLATASTNVELIDIGINSASGSTAQGFADNLSLTSPVPEPSTWAMLLAGFAALGFMGFRRTRSGGVTA